MGIAEAYNASATIGTTEWSLTANAARPGDAPTVLTSGQSTTITATYNTASVTPSGSKLSLFSLCAWCQLPTPPSISISGAWSTWTQLHRDDFSDFSGNVDVQTVALYVGSGTPSTSAVTITWGSAIQGMGWIFNEVVSTGVVQDDGVDNTVGSTTPSITLPSAITAGNASFACVASGADLTYTPRTNWTQSQKVGNSGWGSIMTEYRMAGEQTASATIASNPWGIIAAELGIAAGQAVTTPGVYVVEIDLSNLTSTEVYEFSLYEKVQSGSTQREVMNAFFAGAQTTHWVSPPFILMNGWDMTLRKLSGTDRAIEWSIRSVT